MPITKGSNAEKAAAPFAFAIFSRVDFIDKVKDLFKSDEEFGRANKPDDINRKKTQGAIAVSVLEDTNNVTARIGSGVLNNAADVAQVDAGGFINVVSTLENRPDMTVGSSTEFDPETTSIDGGNVTIALVGEVNNGVSIAVGSTGIYDNANAFIAGNATVNATGDLTVDAQTLNSLDPLSTFGTTLAAPFLISLRTIHPPMASRSSTAVTKSKSLKIIRRVVSPAKPIASPAWTERKSI